MHEGGSVTNAATCRETASWFRTLALGFRTCCEFTQAELCEQRALLYEADAARIESGSRP